ncbi:copper chaperone PCu(A)C [Bacterioplanoides sp.]|uniref:copper chaperone PCu(A)C n=1 Tax=Bacterioplanoides sp. TaxID=2066072 RepID=UPI003B5C9F88
MKFLRTVFAITLMLSPVFAVADSLEIEDAYVREPIPGRYMSAAFLKIENESEKSRTLVSANADWAGLIEIHTHIHDNGVMRMRQLQELEIPAGEIVKLQPGGLHLMLFKLKLPLAKELALDLCFKNGECETVTAKLRSIK